jgi:hypothetical protein
MIIKEKSCSSPAPVLLQPWSSRGAVVPRKKKNKKKKKKGEGVGEGNKRTCCLYGKVKCQFFVADGRWCNRGPADCPIVELPSNPVPTPNYPWKHRSAGMRCRTCMWFVKNEPVRGQNSVGRCRRHAPTTNGYPVVFSDDWCGDHKLNEEGFV